MSAPVHPQSPTAPQETLLENFDALVPDVPWPNWKLWGTASDYVTLDVARVDAGNLAGRLKYALAPGKAKDSYVTINHPSPLSGKPRALRLKVLGDGGGHRLTASLQDSTGEGFNYGDVTVDWRGWREVELEFANCRSHSGGNGDGLLDYPMTFASVNLRFRGNAASGELMFDDLRVECETLPPTELIDLALNTQSPARLFFPDHRERPSLKLSNRGRAAVEATLRLSLHGSNGTDTVREEAVHLEAGNASEVKLLPENPSFGLYDLEALLTLDKDNTRILATRFACIPSPPEPPSRFLGLGFHRVESVLSKDFRQQVPLIAAAGAYWTALEIPWSVVEPERGKFEWAAYDRAVNTAAEYGLGFMAFLGHVPAWSALNDASEPNPATRYARFLEELKQSAQQIAKHYSTVLRLWRAVDLSVNTSGVGNQSQDLPYADRYHAFLETFRSAMKAGNPEALVVADLSPGFCEDFADTLGAATATLAADCDGIVYAPWRLPIGGPSPTDSVAKRSLEEALSLAAGKPVWLADLNRMARALASSRPPDPEGAAKAMIQTLVVARCLPGIVGAGWNDLCDGKHSRSESGNGLLTESLNIKPAYVAYAVQSHYLSRCLFQELRAVAPGTFAAVFRDLSGGSRRTAVAWREVPGEAILSLTTKNPLVVTDWLGAARVAEPNEQGKVSLLVTGAPLYVTGAFESL